ncbi:HAD family hydrolase [Acuticoccus sp. MNP-M23]|uniref:HAD family hydrolase n=1 Tax=Acuticoccus sp. MNP-M23 TaxID=3072793 RepID=UPI002815F0D6|nr:HAD family hydrolase [Acuticoccus sp. MNP-M23]WMS44555.1 HAD family hydrolase [Acuticoccus sp. MNP-M23]
MRRILALAALFALPGFAHADPLPSWNDGDAKAAIVEFVESVTDAAADTYVTPADRIAVFDNDGTLWAEQPVYFQFLYALDKLKEMAAADPSILTSDLLKSAAAGDMKAIAASGTEGMLEIAMVSHSGMATDDFKASVRSWLDTARHPETGMAYDRMIYQPMLELLAYLRDEDFRTFIVSGGGIDFIRVFSQEAYNIPPDQVIGTSGNARYEVADGTPAIMKDPGIFFIDDKEGKPVAIESRLGKRPILAAGNSDGDFQMLEWTTAGDGPRLGLIVHHTDAEREFAYDRDGAVGKLARGLDEAGTRGWLLVDMQDDWATVWPGSR